MKFLPAVFILFILLDQASPADIVVKEADISELQPDRQAQEESPGNHKTLSQQPIDLINTVPQDEKLYVLTSVFMPIESEIRKKLFKDFEKHMAEFPNVELWAIQCAIGNNSFYVTDPDNPHHVRVRAEHYVFFKENLLNVLFSKLPSTAKYVAWIDADIHMCSKTWASDTIQLLKKVDIVQLDNYGVMIGTNGQPEASFESFMVYAVRAYAGPDSKPPQNRLPGHNGFGWAATAAYLRKAGFYDLSLAGAGDLMMGMAAVGRWQGGFDFPTNQLPGLYQKSKQWAENAYPERGYGFVPGKTVHLFHGSLGQRGYGSRSSLISGNLFDPNTDMYYNQDGVLQIKPHKQQLIDGLKNLALRLVSDAQPIVQPDLRVICGNQAASYPTANYVVFNRPKSP